MRLLNVQSYALEEFLGDDVPPYAILSHRWEEEELTFQQLTRNKVYQAFDRTSTKGYKKLKMACYQSVKLKLRYIWIDTCCIDKSSSAELSEAINSMFRWYANASICLAYLSDIGTVEVAESEKHITTPVNGWTGGKVFQESVWFTRAWTLQELIAPRQVHFYDSSWRNIGTKQTLAYKIEAATKIPRAVLMHTEGLDAYSVAERMSWASGRSATRMEDVAYSLLGLFGVYMPLLYGEGEMAFVRLQEEIISRSLDRSFLLWKNEKPIGSLLATSPRDFSTYSNQKAHIGFTHWDHLSSSPFALSNAGLEIELELFWWDMNIYAAEVAHATRLDSNGQYMHWYVLLRFGRQGQYLHRIGIVKHSFPKVPKSRRQKVTIQRELRDQIGPAPDLCGFRIHSQSLSIQPHDNNDSAAFWSTDLSSRLLQCTLNPHDLNSNAYMRCEVVPGFEINIIVSFSFDFGPILCVHQTVKGLYFVHTSELIDEPDLKTQQGAKVALRTSTNKSGGQYWVCKLIDRKGTYVTLPDLFCPSGWTVALYIDFFLGDSESSHGGIWHIAVIKREVTEFKSLLQTFQEDQFFTNEAKPFISYNR